MRLSVLTQSDGVLVVKIMGEADLATSPDLVTGLRGLRVPAGGVVFLDLSLLDFCDASGLDALVRGSRELGKRGVGLALVRPRPHMMRLLRITGLDERFGVFATLAAAERWRHMARPDRREAGGNDGYGGVGKTAL